MNPEICKKCNCLHFFVIDKTMSFDKKPYYKYNFQCTKCITYNWFVYNCVEEFALEKGKWKKVSSNKRWFKFFKKKFIDQQLKNQPCFKKCLYWLEHEIYDANRKEIND